jgi:hypothetical protein
MSIYAYDYGVKDGRAELKEEAIKKIEQEIASITKPMMVDKEYLDGLYKAIDIIKSLQ